MAWGVSADMIMRSVGVRDNCPPPWWSGPSDLKTNSTSHRASLLKNPKTPKKKTVLAEKKCLVRKKECSDISFSTYPAQPISCNSYRRALFCLGLLVPTLDCASKSSNAFTSCSASAGSHESSAGE